MGVTMAKLDSLWNDGLSLGYRSAKSLLEPRAAYSRRERFNTRLANTFGRNRMDTAGGVPRRASTSADGEEGTTPAVDIGMEMPEVDIPKAPKEDKGPVPRRLYIRVEDIERHGPISNCKGCVVTLRGEGGVPHSDTCRKRLTEEIEKSDEGAGAKRARQRESEFYARDHGI